MKKNSNIEHKKLTKLKFGTKRNILGWNLDITLDFTLSNDDISLIFLWIEFFYVLRW